MREATLEVSDSNTFIDNGKRLDEEQLSQLLAM
jgi:hypothetical protein